MRCKLFTTVSAVVAAGGFAAAAGAQSLDYDNLQALFGEPVTAGATGAPQRASDVPATMIIVTADDLGQYPEMDIPGVLRHFAGVEVNRYTFGQADVAIRGYNQPYQPRLLVLVNGRQVYLDHYAYTSWASLPVAREEIQQIEVIKGPQSALYGFNAVAGVINIITRDPANANYAGASVDAGGDGYVRGSAAIGHAINDRLAVRFSVNALTGEEFDTGPRGGETPGRPGTEGFSRAADVEQTAASAGFSVQITPKVKASLDASVSSVDQPEMLPNYNLAAAETDTVSFVGVLEADTSYGLVTARAYQNTVEYFYATNPAAPTGEPLENTVSVLQVQNLFKAGSANTFRIGAEYRTNEMNSAPIPGQGDTRYDVYSVSGMWDRKLTSNLTLTLAGRFDRLELERTGDPDPATFLFSAADYDRSIEEFSYNAALAWRPDAKSAVRLSAARGVQTPSLVEFGFTLPTNVGGMPIAVSGNPLLDPTIVDSVELAYDRAVGSNATFRSAVFYSTTEDYKGILGAVPDLLPPAAPLPTFLWSNQGDSEILGFEASLDGVTGAGVRWGLGYTWQSVEDELTVNQTGFFYPVDFENSTPEHQAEARLGYDWNKWSFDAFALAVSETVQPRQTTLGFLTAEEVDAWVSLSLRAAYALNDRVELSLNARDVTYGEGVRTTSAPKTESLYFARLSARF